MITLELSRKTMDSLRIFHRETVAPPLAMGRVCIEFCFFVTTRCVYDALLSLN